MTAIRDELRERLAELQGEQQAGRGAAARAAHDVRPRDARADGLLQGHRELLAPPVGPRAGRAAADAARLLPQGLPAVRRRVAPDRPADRRDVPRRPLAQGDAGRVRLPPAVGARQPAAASSTSGRRASTQAVFVSATPAEYELQRGAGRGRRADHPPDRPARSRDRGAARSAARSTTCSSEIRERVEGGRARAGHDADQAHGRGPHRVLRRARRARALPALGHRHARAHRDPARPAPGRVRRAGRHQPAARGAGPARGVAGRRSSTPTRKASCAPSAR